MKKLNCKLGDTFGNWTVVDDNTFVKSGHTYVKVQCDCGTVKWVQANELTNPNRNFKCAAQAERNGKVGELTLTRFTKLQRSAEKRNIEFLVSLEYLSNLYESQNHICAITGRHINSIDEASLDRIDSSKGYIEGNVQWTTYQANVSKHTMTMEELYQFCKDVLNHANQQPSQPLTKLEGSETNS